MHEVVYVTMCLGVVTTFLAILSATFGKHKYVPWLLSFTIVFILTAVVTGRMYSNVKIRYCKTKQAVYLKDQDACFKLIEVK